MADFEGDDEAIAVGIFAPKGRDAELLVRTARAGGSAFAVEGMEGLIQAVRGGSADLLLVTQEGLEIALVDALGAVLEGAEPWDELPILLLVDGRGNTPDQIARLREALPTTRILVLQRPLRMAELESSLAMLRRVRARQYAQRDFIARETELRRELNHRVKNILATVQALYSLSARQALDYDAFRVSFQGRMSAMARVHDHLFDDSYGPTVLTDAMAAALAPFDLGDGRIVARGAPIRVSAQAAQSFGLIVHELATNAGKYGALRDEQGRVSVDVIEEGETVRIEWNEAGGPPVVPPRRSGYGTAFIQSMARQFKGTAEADYAPGGLTVRIEVSRQALGVDASGKDGRHDDSGRRR